MSVKYLLSRSASVLVAVLFAFSLTAAVTFAASQFEGTWNTQDTKGNPFKITLSADGEATGDRAELPLEPSDALWAELAVGSDRCAGRRCPYFSACLAEAARAVRAAGGHVVGAATLAATSRRPSPDRATGSSTDRHTGSHSPPPGKGLRS